MTLDLQMFDCVFGGVLHMFEAVTHKFGATKPPRYTDDTVAHLFFLHNSQDHHSCPSFTIVRLGFINESVLADPRCPTVVGGFCVFFVFL